MNHCMFSHKCGFARHREDQILYEDDFINTNETLFMRKFAFKRTNVSPICGESCPVYAVTYHLLRENRLLNSNVGVKITDSDIQTCRRIFDEEIYKTYPTVLMCNGSRSAAEVADIVTYYGICSAWKGSGMSDVVYNLNFSTYIDEDRKTWGSKSSDVTSSKLSAFNNAINSKNELGEDIDNVLIISGLDYMHFRDNPCEKLFEIIAKRDSEHHPLIIVSPVTSNLMGEGLLFGRLTDMLNKHKVMSI